ncbi:MAG: hypothetical protein HY209_00760 [Candidatus Omnitrophica bacterium]|nr:hypothetical protein [Candidatus Omnitrophota bacterium]
MTLIFCLGCQTTQPKEPVSALGTLTEGLTNQQISQQDLKNLAVQVQNNPQTKSAVQSIHQALSAGQKGVKYCPVDGQRFDASVDICPIHKVKLKTVD